MLLSCAEYTVNTCHVFCHRRRNAGILPSLEDLLFYAVADGQEKIPAHKFLTVSSKSFGYIDIV